MKKTVIRFGLLSVSLLIVAGLINFFVNKDNFQRQEIGGYTAIFLSTIFVYFGIRQYRDKFGSGVLSYGKALQVGFLIVIFPSIAFGIFDLIYTKIIDPGFMEKYYTMAAKQLENLPPAVRDSRMKEMEQQKAMFSNPAMEFLLMAITVFIPGIMVAAISSLILYRKPKIASSRTMVKDMDAVSK